MLRTCDLSYAWNFRTDADRCGFSDLLWPFSTLFIFVRKLPRTKSTKVKCIGNILDLQYSTLQLPSFARLARHWFHPWPLRCLVFVLTPARPEGKTAHLTFWDGACAHYVMVSKFQWKPFWLATQRDPQNDWTATQNRVNYDVFAQAPLYVTSLRILLERDLWKSSKSIPPPACSVSFRSRCWRWSVTPNFNWSSNCKHQLHTLKDDVSLGRFFFF